MLLNLFLAKYLFKIYNEIKYTPHACDCQQFSKAVVTNRRQAVQEYNDLMDIKINIIVYCCMRLRAKVTSK